MGLCRFLALSVGFCLALACTDVLGAQRAGRDVPAGVPDLKRVSGLEQGRGYTLMLKGTRAIGTVLVLTAGVRHISLVLEVSVAPFGGFRGRVSLRMLDSHGRFELQVNGQHSDGKRELLRESVAADPYLLANGVLTFRWQNGARFFQLSRDSRSLPKATTDWGTVGLVALPMK